MKRRLTAFPIGVGAREAPGVGAQKGPPDETFTHAAHASLGGAGAGARAHASNRPVALASVSERTHTLVLSGELTHRSAHAVEVEIERLCAEGVTGITIDLRELAEIDPIGVAVIAFRSGLCRRRGYEFTLIAGSRQIRRAFEQAGVAYLLPPDEEAVSPPEPARVRPLALAHS
jgi:anti-anti-sigma factor